ncbi:hypothetical protein CsSME_00036771 [Camellia sinensis var. sinensis]
MLNWLLLMIPSSPLITCCSNGSFSSNLLRGRPVG